MIREKVRWRYRPWVQGHPTRRSRRSPLPGAIWRRRGLTWCASPAFANVLIDSGGKDCDQIDCRAPVKGAPVRKHAGGALAGSACFHRWKEGNRPMKSVVLPPCWPCFSLAGCASAAPGETEDRIPKGRQTPGRRRGGILHPHRLQQNDSLNPYPAFSQANRQPPACCLTL